MHDLYSTSYTPPYIVKLVYKLLYPFSIHSHMVTWLWIQTERKDFAVPIDTIKLTVMPEDGGTFCARWATNSNIASTRGPSTDKDTKSKVICPIQSPPVTKSKPVLWYLIHLGHMNMFSCTWIVCWKNQL